MIEDLRQFIERVDDLGALRRFEGVDPQFELGGIKLGPPVDLFAPHDGRPPTLAVVELGVVDLGAGAHVLAVETTGKHADAKGFLMAADYFKLEAIG